MEKEILCEFGFDAALHKIHKFGSGLINNTWVVEEGEGKYILQKINDDVFKRPQDIAFNIDLIGQYLQDHHEDYFFTAPVKTMRGKSILKLDGSGYYRVFPFVKDSRSIDVVETPHQAYEAARQFGRFTKLLSGVDVAKLKITLPDFHNLTLRYEQYQRAREIGNPERIGKCSDLIERLEAYQYIAAEYELIQQDPDFKLRVMHHDTKISNVLFDKHDNGICVIDLDTVMPGYFISDVGDMMRTYLSPVSEEERDYEKIEIRDEFYRAIVNGYREEMGGQLTAKENQSFFYAGTFMIYMQALRFITDYMNNDVYYGAKYEDHNYVRGANQLALLEKLSAKKDEFADF